MTPNQYTDTYKRLSDEKLINIIDNKNDYQPLAIETAIFELQSRQLSDKQINDARQSIVDIKNKKDQSDKKVNERIEAVKNTADKALTILDPLVEKNTRQGNKINQFTSWTSFNSKNSFKFLFNCFSFQRHRLRLFCCYIYF